MIDVRCGGGGGLKHTTHNRHATNTCTVNDSFLSPCDLAMIWKRLLVPGCATSCAAAAKRTAKRSTGGMCVIRPVFTRKWFVDCITSAPWIFAWYWRGERGEETKSHTVKLGSRATQFDSGAPGYRKPASQICDKYHCLCPAPHLTGRCASKRTGLGKYRSSSSVRRACKTVRSKPRSSMIPLVSNKKEDTARSGQR